MVYRGLALTHVGKKEEAEEVRTTWGQVWAHPPSSQCYLHAHRLQPSNALASHGLRKLYEKDEQWEKLGRFLEALVQTAYDQCVSSGVSRPYGFDWVPRQDAEKCIEALQELLELRMKDGAQDQASDC